MPSWYQYKPTVKIGDHIEYNCLGVKDSGIVQEIQWFMNRWDVIFESDRGNGEICGGEHYCTVKTRSYKDVR